MSLPPSSIHRISSVRRRGAVQLESIVLLVAAVSCAGALAHWGRSAGDALAGEGTVPATRPAAMVITRQAAVAFDLAEQVARMEAPRTFARLVDKLGRELAPANKKGFASIDLGMPAYKPAVHGHVTKQQAYDEFIARLFSEATGTTLRVSGSSALSTRYREYDGLGRTAYNPHTDADGFLFTMTQDLRRLKRHGTELFPAIHEMDVEVDFGKSLSRLTEEELRPFLVRPPAGHLVVIPTTLFTWTSPIPALRHLQGLVHRAPNFGEGPRVGVQTRLR